MIVTLTLNPSVDYVLQVPQLLTEDTMRATSAFFQAGGKGINVSRVLTRLGIENTAWGFCGGDTGCWLTAFLEEENVAHDFITTEAPTRINPIITDTSTYKQLRVSASGGQLQNVEETVLLNRFKNLKPGISWIAMGGSLPPGMTASTMRQLMELASKANIPTVLDADGDVLREGLEGKPILIKPNQYELARLTGQSIDSKETIVAASRGLIEAGKVQMVVTSLAEEGALLITRDVVLRAKAPKVTVASKVGAGDSMVAGLLKGMMEKQVLADTLKSGIAAGTAAVMTPGTELCYRHDYETLLQQVVVEQLD